MKRGAAELLLLPGAVALVYANAFRGGFQFDDYNVIVGNPAVHSWGAFLADLPHGIRPLLKLTYTLNWTSGGGIFGFHLLNAALHAANAVLLFRVARLLSAPAVSGFAALFAALLFAVHPVQTEAVTYISGRSVSLMSFFYLGSVLAWLRGRERGSVFLLRGASPLLFLLAMLSKEVALTLPFALLLLETARGTAWRDALRAQSVHWGLLLLLAGLLLAHPGYGRLLESCFDIRGVPANLMTQIHGIAYLLSRLVSPHALNIDPDLPVFERVTPFVAGEAVFLGVLFSAGIAGLGRRSAAGFGILWFFLHLVPTNSFVPRLDVANERQLYLASWGLFLALGAGADRIRERAGLLPVAAVAASLAIALGILTISRNGVYRSEIALWEDTAGKSPGKARAHNNLGYAYELAGRFGDAEASYLRAMSIDPGYVRARENLARLALRRNRRSGIFSGAGIAREGLHWAPNGR
ncbi:MAG: tetratricopeptide repeat protein [Deltaproteobacteria bacterium]|nr:tetratricopeptide repeat protein [Deltaproteobacteria bacterium]